MKRFIIVSSSTSNSLFPSTKATTEDAENPEDVISKKSIRSCIEKIKVLHQDKIEDDFPMLKIITTDSNLQVVKEVFPKHDWSTLQDINNILSSDEAQCSGEESSSDKDVLLADLLHDVIDTLPYAGASVRVILFDNFAASSTSEYGDSPPEFVIALAGAVRRLSEWHNGTVALVCNKSGVAQECWDILFDFGRCEIINTDDGYVDEKVSSFFETASWEGKIAVMDRIESKGHVFSGFRINYDDWDTFLLEKYKSCCYRPSVKASTLGKRRQRQPPSSTKPSLATKPVCGRTIEVLQEVDLRTFPFFLMDSSTLKLNIKQGHSDVLMEHIQELEQVGLLARLLVYPDKTVIPQCGNTNTLNTGAWKRMILGSECDEPQEKRMADDTFFLYLLLLPTETSDFTNTDVDVRVLLSPKELNRDVVRIAKEQAMYKRGVANALHDSVDMTGVDCDNVHVLNQKETLTKLVKLLEEHKKNTAQEIFDQTQGKNKSEAKKIEIDILDVASEVQERIFNLAFQGYPTLTEFMAQGRESHLSDSLRWMSESAMDPSLFPEKLALQSKHAKRTELKSYPSAESCQGSSPILPEELEKRRNATDFSIDDILRMFKDGKPIELPFKQEKLEGRNLCRVDSTPDLSTPWPNSQSLQYHDIYYYMDESDLALEKKYSEVRDKLLVQDTLSSFVSPIKKHKPQPLRKISPVRSSPRRRNSAKHLMTRSRSDSNQSGGSGGQIFKQPSQPDLISPPIRRTPSSSQTTHRNSGMSFSQPGGSSSRYGGRNSRLSFESSSGTPNSSLSQSSIVSHNSASRSDSSYKRNLDGSFRHVSQSTPLSVRRESPRKRMLAKSFSSTWAKDYAGASQHESSTFAEVRKLNQLKASGVGQSSSTNGGRLSRSFSFDTQVRRSPRKSYPNLGSQASSSRLTAQVSKTDLSGQSGSPSIPKDFVERSTPVLDIDESSSQSFGGSESAKRKRSDKHKMKLQSIIKTVLAEKGVTEADTIYSACYKNIYNVSVVLLRTLASSRNLNDEMNNVVQSQVHQIINLEKRRCGISL